MQGWLSADDSLTPGGEWERNTGFILLPEHRAAVPDVRLAATLVHEATHAWLEAAGFEYAPARRARIEAICFRAEAAFYRRLPEANDFAREEFVRYAEERAAQVRSQPLSHWTESAFRARTIARMRALGAPHWVVKVAERLAARRAA